MNVRSLVAGLCLLGSASAAVAATPACAPTIEHAWVRAAPPGASTLAAYAVVRNHCAQAFVITEVSSDDFAMSMIHETRVENGVGKMRHVASLPLPANGVVRFAPGGKHLMLMKPTRQLKADDNVKISFKLDDGRSISADFPILKEAAPAM